MNNVKQQNKIQDSATVFRVVKTNIYLRREDLTPCKRWEGNDNTN